MDAVGRNYKSHIADRNIAPAPHPPLFWKPASCIIGTDENIVFPEGANNVHYEAEMVVVIGKKAKNVSKADAPGCIFEMIFSPTLHERVYGYPAFADFLQSVRMGGYRPVMFMQHGLMVGTFMCAAAMMGIWLWWNGALKPVFKFPKATPVIFVTLVAIACKSAGAILLMFVGLGVRLALSSR